MEALKKRQASFRSKGIIAIVLVYAIIAAILFVQLSGVQVNFIEKGMELVPENYVVTKQQAQEGLVRDTLLLYNSKAEDSLEALRQFSVIFADMKVGCDKVDLANQKLPSFDDYRKLVVLMSDLSPLGEDVVTLGDWVENGGRCMLPMTLDKNAYFSLIEGKLGIVESDYAYSLVHDVYVEKDFMAGGGRAFEVPGGFESAITVQLSKKNTEVFAYEATNHIPLVWRTKCKDGIFVVNNIGLYEKALRGFYAASYSLLDSVCAYPVINGSVFYLDDFPSPIPEGINEYIQRDYNTTIHDYYINIWWPDMMNFSDRYGMKYTGLVIQSYDNNVDGTTNTVADTSLFLNFGNMLLRKGGELGYHGYNHQPLCFDNCDYKGLYDYKTWQSYEAMKKAFDNLYDFCESVFPDVEMASYVPPSNLLSKEGRAFLLKEYPNIKTISGIYFEDDALDFSCTQEFDVDENGVVDQPRIISGCSLTEFMEIAAVSELNFHYVNNHFTHPDDALDPERGAEMGWEKLKEEFDEFLSWLYTSAPKLRNFTGTQMSAAVQRYVALTPVTKVGENNMTITSGNFYDEAQYLVRFNEKTPDKVKGGKLTHVTGDLYLLEADEKTVNISFK